MKIPRNVPVYPMRSVVKATGIEANRLRYWETKYHILRPNRDLQGCRLYTQEQVDLIKKIGALADDKGVSLTVINDIIAAADIKQANP